MTAQRIVGFDNSAFDSEKAFAEKIGTDIIENPYPKFAEMRCQATLAGIELPEGAALDVIIGAANRDPAQFPDPDHFDIHRKGQRMLAFGFGPHVCIGQHLARLEITVALNALLDKLPNLRLDPDEPALVVRGLALRAADSINVIWG